MQSTNWLTPGKKLIWMNRIVLSLWSRRIFDPWRFGWFSIETIWKKIIIFHVPDSVLVRYSNSSTVPLCETHIFSRLKRNEKRRNRLVRLFCFVSKIHFLRYFLFQLMFPTVDVDVSGSGFAQFSFHCAMPNWVALAKSGKNYAAKWKACAGGRKNYVAESKCGFSIGTHFALIGVGHERLLLVGPCDRADGAVPCRKYFHWNFGNCVWLFSGGASCETARGAKY